MESRPRMLAGQLDTQLPGSHSLAVLALEMRLALDSVQELRRGPVVKDRLSAAREVLLMAMERYAAELTARGLPVPRELHRDLRLQRDLRQHHDALG
jgi:hypothetical protein